MKRKPANLLMESYRAAHYYRKDIARILLVIVVLSLVLTLYKAAFRPVYESSTKFTMLPQPSEIEYAMQSMALSPVSPAYFLSQTHTEFLLSRTIAEDVLKALDREGVECGEKSNLLTRYVVRPFQSLKSGLKGLIFHGTFNPKAMTTDRVNELRNRIRVRQVPGSFVLELTVSHSDPECAAKTANLITEKCIEWTLKANRAEMRVTREYLEAEIAQTEEELKRIEDRMLRFKESNQFYVGALDVSLKLRELSDYLKEYSDTKVDLMQVEGRIEAFRPHRSSGSMVGIEAERESLRAKKDALEKIIAEKTDVLNEYPENEQFYVQLVRERNEKEKALSELRLNILKTRAAEASKLSTLRIIDRAIPPTFPSEPKLLMNIAAAILLGLIVSGGYIAGRESWNRHIRNGDDLAGLPGVYWGPVPYLPPWADRPGAKRALSIMDRAGRQILAAVFRFAGRGSVTTWYDRMFRLHLEQVLDRCMESAEHKMLLLTGIDAGDGKSFLAARLADLAAKSDRKIALIDADFEHPHLHELIGQPMNRGLTDWMSGRSELSDIVQQTASGIDFVSAGAAKAEVAATWPTDRVDALRDRFAETYDLTIMVAPAVHEHPKATASWRASDVLCVVLDADRTTEGELEDMRRRLDVYKGTIGYVLNDVKFRGDFLFQSGSRS